MKKTDNKNENQAQTVEKREPEYDYAFNVFEASRKNAKTGIRLARSFGKPLLKQPTQVLIDFVKTKPASEQVLRNGWSEEVASKFFVAGMYCYCHRNDTKYQSYTKKFQDALKELYEKSTSAQRTKIEALFSMDLNEKGRLTRELGNIVKTNRNMFENIDYQRLQRDLRYWNLDRKNGLSVREQWAITVACCNFE